MPKRTLVIEDNDLVRETLKTMLEFLGIEVVVAEDGKKALEKFISEINANNPFDVVFVDLIMPKMSGKEVMAKLREIDPNVKAVISSVYSNDKSFVEYEKLGFKGILKKPYTLEELKETLRKLNIL